jgi:hypothetical protein
VLVLNDGGRVYLEYTLDDSEPSTGEELDLADMPAGHTHPVLDSEVGVVWYRPDHINRHLGLTGPSVH